ncbi:hypothetical protein [Azospirillum endophyticum]
MLPVLLRFRRLGSSTMQYQMSLPGGPRLESLARMNWTGTLL